MKTPRLPAQPAQSPAGLSPVEAGCRQGRVGPVAVPNVEPQRPGGVRHLLDRLAAQAKSEIRLGQQHCRDAIE